MNTRSPLFKYQLGLLVLGLATLILVIFLVIQGSVSRQDAKTNKAAIAAASKLDDYILENSRIPASLDEAGVTDVPKTIKYEKLSDESYRFCTTYKADSDSVDASTIFTDALTGYYGVPNDFYDPDSSSYLYVSTSFKKGERCQTITPYIYSIKENESSSSQTSSGPYFKCEQSYNYYLFAQPVESITTDKITTSGSFGSTYELDPDVKVFNLNCDEISLSTITVGDSVSLFFNPYGSPVTTIVREN